MQYSLNHLATVIHEKIDSGIAFAPGASLYWTGLRQLFMLINDGWEDHIPQYNGGLFNPQQHPFLENYEIGDDTLAQVIELLTRTEKGERIAYRDLDVRHLGNIYEGLLEYQPQTADQDLAIVSKRGNETVTPKSSPNQEVAYQAGEVYLLTDKGNGRRPAATTPPITSSDTLSKTPSRRSVRAKPLTKSYPSKSSIPPQGAGTSSSALSIISPKS